MCYKDIVITDNSSFETNSDYFVCIYDPTVLKINTKYKYPPDYIKICVYDIETTSVDGNFPDPKTLGNKITQICCIIADQNNIINRYAFCLGPAKN